MLEKFKEIVTTNPSMVRNSLVGAGIVAGIVIAAIVLDKMGVFEDGMVTAVSESLSESVSAV